MGTVGGQGLGLITGSFFGNSGWDASLGSSGGPFTVTDTWGYDHYIVKKNYSTAYSASYPAYDSVTVSRPVGSGNIFIVESTGNYFAGIQGTTTPLGTPTAASTVTLSQSTGGDSQSLTNNAAFTLAPPSIPSGHRGQGCLDGTNGASAGVITTTGWTKVTGTPDTVSGHKFKMFWDVSDVGSYLNIVPMQ